MGSDPSPYSEAGGGDGAVRVCKMPSVVSRVRR